MKLVEAMLRGVSVALVGLTMCDSYLVIVCIIGEHAWIYLFGYFVRVLCQIFLAPLGD